MRLKRILLLVGVIVSVLMVASPINAQSVTLPKASVPTDAEISFALDSIKQIAKDGVGNKNAVAVMPTLNRARLKQLPMILEGFNGSSPLQRNWLMGAVNRVAENSDTDLPLEAIEDHFTNYDNDDYGRLVAFELMTRNDEPLKQKMIRELWTDPSPPLRFMAIADLIQQAKKLDGDENKPAGVALLKKALDNALDVDQIQSIAQQLKSKGKPVNLQKIMGFVSPWKIVAGFDNTDSKGFDVPYGPELDVKLIDPEATYNDASGQTVRWKEVETESDTGVFDLNKLIGQEDDRTAYAYTTFSSPIEGSAEVRIGTPNAHKIWLNGKLVMSNEIYHNSTAIDKFVSRVELKQGSNEVLVKLCQNNMTQSWAQDWQFQLRFCDEDSKPILQPQP
ncbi:hypothetical protein N9Y42_04890 [Mariniblastus sp.]|nr:hypothetical protein [Mariniblastus sp.]